jgi:hypothetical protein
LGKAAKSRVSETGPAALGQGARFKDELCTGIKGTDDAQTVGVQICVFGGQGFVLAADDITQSLDGLDSGHNGEHRARSPWTNAVQGMGNGARFWACNTRTGSRILKSGLADYERLAVVRTRRAPDFNIRTGSRRIKVGPEPAQEHFMALPDTYTLKPGSIPAYFDAILQAQAPERFSVKFLDGLEFKSTNDRSLVGILKDLGFLDADAVPTKRYYEFLDRSQSRKVLASAIRETYGDLFAVNKDAYKLSAEEVKNKLRTLYAGSKKDGLIARIASTFTALCEYADFSSPPSAPASKEEKHAPPKPAAAPLHDTTTAGQIHKPVSLDSLQYHINIVLPESRDQAVYDAIFKSLRDHLR